MNGYLLAASAVFVVGGMWLVWLLCWRFRTPNVIDVAWAIVLTTLCVFNLLLPQPNEVTVLYSLIIVVWGLRLGLYRFYTRLVQGTRDKRYLNLGQSWQQPWLFYLLFCQMQGLILLFLAQTAAAINSSGVVQLAWYDGVAAIAAIAAVIFQATADEQLHRFRQLFPGAVCDVGLWRYSRHPNYFFEWLFWLIIAGAAFVKSQTYLSFAAPFGLYVLMHGFTIRWTEAGSLAAKGEGYLAYQRRTPRFFLGRVKRGQSLES